MGKALQDFENRSTKNALMENSTKETSQKSYNKSNIAFKGYFSIKPLFFKSASSLLYSLLRQSYSVVETSDWWQQITPDSQYIPVAMHTSEHIFFSSLYFCTSYSSGLFSLLLFTPLTTVHFFLYPFSQSIHVLTHSFIYSLIIK
jgi:hypothetical protein